MNEIKLTKFNQIGILVKDIKKSKRFFENLLGLDKELQIVEQQSTAIYKEKEVHFKLKKIVQDWNNIQLEIIEVGESDGDHLYLDCLRNGDIGMHHLGIYVKNAEIIINFLKENFNVGVVQRGNVGKKVSFYFLDTKDLIGFYLELIQF